MKKASLELAVGIFVLIGLTCVGYLTVRLGDMEFFEDEHYFLNARFQSVAGLKAGANIEIAGVQVGLVDAISLDLVEQVAIVQLKIKKKVVTVLFVQNLTIK